ncbi:MAG: ribosomal-processing cysteine protease Prp [Oscillospiraceae bacterium]|nr:ribosomal-processing cysteine protease Prp [Oscillospiraceae bacterium]
MIKAVFFKKDGRLSGFSLSGHAGYGTRGNDV